MLQTQVKNSFFKKKLLLFFTFFVFFSVIFGKKVFDSVLFIPGEGVEADRMDAVEDAFFDVGVRLFQLFYKHFDFLPFGLTDPVAAFVAGFGKAAGALQEFEPVVIFPRDYVFLADAVQRADELHPLEIRTLELGHHPLELRAVEHTHHRRFDNVVHVVPERDLAASELFRL